MKFKIFAIMLSACVVLVGGISVAYYNTKSLGFDDEVYIVSRDNEKISVLDYDFYYKDLSDAYNKLKSIIPEKIQNITTY